jgi:hypothetical protein
MLGDGASAPYKRPVCVGLEIGFELLRKGRVCKKTCAHDSFSTMIEILPAEYSCQGMAVSSKAPFPILQLTFMPAVYRPVRAAPSSVPALDQAQVECEVLAEVLAACTWPTLQFSRVRVPFTEHIKMSGNDDGGRTLGGEASEPLPQEWRSASSAPRVGRIGDWSASNQSR